MTNVEFIATYIFNNPGSRYTQIMEAFRGWRGKPEYEFSWGTENRNRSKWGNQYFNRYATASNQDIDTHWTYVEPDNPRSGYVLTTHGLGWVRDQISDHPNDFQPVHLLGQK